MMETQTDANISAYELTMVGSMHTIVLISLWKSRYHPSDKRAVQSTTEWFSREDESNLYRDGPLNDLSHGYWSYLVRWSYWWQLYAPNRIPNTARPNSSPFENMYGSKPDLSHFAYLVPLDMYESRIEIKLSGTERQTSLYFLNIRTLRRRTEFGVWRETDWWWLDPLCY